MIQSARCSENILKNVWDNWFSNLTILAFLSQILCVFLLSKFVSLIMISRHMDIDIALAISTPSCSLKQDQLQPWLPNTLYNWKEYDLFTWCTTDRLNSLRSLMFPKFYIPYIKYSCMLCLFMIIGANVFFLKISPLLKTDRTVQWIEIKLKWIKQTYMSKKFI